MPICNPIKCSAALLQSRYDSLVPRGTDRESGATQVCLCFEECVWESTNTGKHSKRDRTNVCMCVRSDGPQQDKKWVSPNFQS